MDCLFVDAGRIVIASKIDGVHLAAPQHLQLGQALAHEVNAFLVHHA